MGPIEKSKKIGLKLKVKQEKQKLELLKESAETSRLSNFIRLRERVNFYPLYRMFDIQAQDKLEISGLKEKAQF